MSLNKFDWIQSSGFGGDSITDGGNHNKIDAFFVLFFFIYPSLVLVQPRKTRPYITERLLMECKESNQTRKQNKDAFLKSVWID